MTVNTEIEMALGKKCILSFISSIFPRYYKQYLLRYVLMVNVLSVIFYMSTNSEVPRNSTEFFFVERSFPEEKPLFLLLVPMQSKVDNMSVGLQSHNSPSRDENSLL